MVGQGGSSADSYLADPTTPIPSHCASIVATSTLRVNCNHNIPARPSGSAKLLTIMTKCAVYCAVVLLTLLYGAESWTVYMAQSSQLECLHDEAPGANPG